MRMPRTVYKAKGKWGNNTYKDYETTSTSRKSARNMLTVQVLRDQGGFRQRKEFKLHYKQVVLKELHAVENPNQLEFSKEEFYDKSYEEGGPPRTQTQADAEMNANE